MRLMVQTRLFEIEEYKDKDVVYTPRWCAQDIVDHFKPSGIVLDPCRGGGAFSSLIPGCEWCEVREGKDFFNWTKKVDWIVGNPPYSGIPNWCRRSFELADNIVYLIPCRSVFFGPAFIESIYRWGGIVEMRHYGGGQKLGFPMGNAVGAFHFQRGYSGPIQVSFGKSA
jgi:hypothetical protein